MNYLKNRPQIPPDYTLHWIGVLTAIVYSSVLLFDIDHALEVLLLFAVPMVFWGVLQHPKLNSIIELQPKLVLMWAVVFRLATWQVHPILEDDHFRYLWDGFVFSEFGTPYLQAPVDFFRPSLVSPVSIPLEFQRILSQVSYPDIKTVYGPVLQWLFYYNYQVFNGTLLGWQTLILVFDLAFVALLYPLVSNRLFFQISWLPLSIFNFSMNVHADIVPIVFLLLVIHLHRNSYQGFTWLKDCVLGVFLALALLSKIFVLILLPFFILARPRSMVALIATVCFFYGPFLHTGATDILNVASLPGGWTFNAPLQPWRDSVVFPLFQYCAFGLFFLVFCFSLRAVIRELQDGAGITEIPYGEYLYITFFAAGGTLNSWYLLWLLIPFSFKKPQESKPLLVWLFSSTFFLSYCTGLGLGNLNLDLYEVAPWALALEYLIPIAVLCAVYANRNHFFARPFLACARNSVFPCSLLFSLSKSVPRRAGRGCWGKRVRES